MDPARALPVSPDIKPRRMPAQTCTPQHTFGGQPFSPQPAKAADQPSPTTDTRVDESGRKMTYAELIHMALLSSETQQMRLSELYGWFKRNTWRANRGKKGWKNSVRSNLCLNKAFERLDGKGSYWKLVDAALKQVQPTRKPRTDRRKKVRVSTAKRNGMPSSPTSRAPDSCNVPQVTVSDARHDHHSPWSLGSSTSPEKSQFAGEPSSNYPTPSPAVSTENGLGYMLDPLWAWNLDSGRYVNWPYCSCFCSRHKLGRTDISGTFQLCASTPGCPPPVANARVSSRPYSETFVCWAA
ncbi:Putative forkhead box protein J2/3 [Colletotrichum destructivum]|uniref:Forkhead box protein J2/3 n=1 Tax=Colletotrichum destructivum TaxID=34406 RepID=A0AAX4I236_9PEZI|nr:Putative forkhead box protein J2/3 [Colletotrichum destructivum]